MKLLFNEQTKFRDILGFLDGDYKFIALKPDLVEATNDLIKIIGEPIYESVVEIYESSSSEDDEKYFLERVQYPICLDAYRHSAKGSDLGHTPNGRNNRIEDNQRIAFEWQIERSDRELERKYYKSIDSLINYLDNKVDEWKDTDAYKASHNLFIRNVDEFEQYFPIGSSRLLFLKLAGGIRKAEYDQIIPRIGLDKYNALKEGLKTDATDLDQKLLALIREALVFESLSWAIPRMSAQLFPEGLLQVPDTSRLTTSARMAAVGNVAEALSQRFQKDAKTAYSKIEEYVKVPVLPIAPYQPMSPNFNPDDNFVDC